MGEGDTVSTEPLYRSIIALAITPWALTKDTIVGNSNSRSNNVRCGNKSGDYTERQTNIRWRLADSNKSENQILTGSVYMGAVELVFLANVPRRLLDPNEESYCDDDFKAPCYVITKLAHPKENSGVRARNVSSDLTEAQTTINLHLVRSTKNADVWLLTGSYFLDKIELVMIGNIPRVLLVDPPDGVSDEEFFTDADYTAPVYSIFKIAKPRDRSFRAAPPSNSNLIQEEEQQIDTVSEDTAAA